MRGQLQHLNPNPLQNYLPGGAWRIATAPPPLAFELFSLRNIHLFLCIYKVTKRFVALFFVVVELKGALNVVISAAKEGRF
jgi:hypothetical protein